MSEEMKGTSTVMEAASADVAEQNALLEFTDQEILDYEEGTLTGKEKAKFLLLTPTVNTIIKFSIIGIGLISTIFWLLAALIPGFSDALSGFYKGFTGVLAAINNFLPFSVMEIVVILTALGWLGYLVFIIVRFIQTHKNGKLLATRLWIQFGYSTLAVLMVIAMLFSFGYGIIGNRTAFHNATAEINGQPMYTNTKSYEAQLSEALLYFIDKLNTTVIEDAAADQTIVYNGNTGASKPNVSGSSTAKISAAVNEAFKRAAEDIPALAGSEITAKELLAGPIYNALNIGSIYSPLTGEALINPYFPKVATPMLIAKAIAKQRGFQSDTQADMIAYIVCSQYSDVAYVQYSAYFNAYLSCGNYLARHNAANYATLAGALKNEIKKEVIYYTKSLDKLYGNTSSISYADNSSQSSSENYLVYPELMINYYRQKMARLANEQEFNYGYYVNCLIDLYRNDADYQDNINAVVEQYTAYNEVVEKIEVEADTSSTEE
ncbi:MAG: DUF3810 family protein [Clostridia bacterium]|nr:DUF3810 family protein [Clostridia bacterium]